MKQAIRLVIFCLLIFIAKFAFIQPAYAEGKKALFLPNNNSNAAQIFINSTKIDSSKNAVATNSNNIAAQKPVTTITNNIVTPKPAAINTNNIAQKKPAVTNTNYIAPKKPATTNTNSTAQKKPVAINNSTNKVNIDKFQISESSVTPKSNDSTITTLYHEIPISSETTEGNNITEEVDEGSLPLFTENISTQTTTLPPSSNSLTATLSLFTSLITIIILALVASWFIQKKAIFNSSNFGKVLGIVPLDNKRFIYIVDVMGKMLVLGVTESNISFLTEITDKDTIDAYRLNYGQTVTPGLDKLFPFLQDVFATDNNNKNDNEKDNESNLTDIQAKLKSDRKSAEINNSIEQKHKERLERLNKMIINSKL